MKPLPKQQTISEKIEMTNGKLYKNKNGKWKETDQTISESWEIEFEKVRGE